MPVAYAIIKLKKHLMASEGESLMLFLFFKVHNRIIRVILMLLRNSCITIVMAFLIIIISLDIQLMI